jgi:hypothetical protein
MSICRGRFTSRDSSARAARRAPRKAAKHAAAAGGTRVALLGCEPKGASMKVSSIPLSLAAVVGLSPLVAAAAPAPALPPPAVATVEVSDAGAQGAAATTRFAVPLTADHPTEVAFPSGARQFDVVTTLGTDRTGGPLLAVHFKMSAPRQPDLRLDVTAPATRGQRTVLADLARPDGSHFSLAVTLR